MTEQCGNCGIALSEKRGKDFARRPFYYPISESSTIAGAVEKMTELNITPAVKTKKSVPKRYMCYICTGLLSKISKHRGHADIAEREFRSRTAPGGYLGKKMSGTPPKKGTSRKTPLKQKRKRCQMASTPGATPAGREVKHQRLFEEKMTDFREVCIPRG